MAQKETIPTNKPFFVPQKEIQLFDIGFLGNPVRPNDISHLRELTDALEKHMGKYK